MAEQDVARADAQALEWLLALHEEPQSAELVARFEAWRAADPSHAAAWKEAARVYGAIGEVPPVHAERWASVPGGEGRALPGARRERPVRTAGGRGVARRRLVAGLAASAAALIVAVTAPGVVLGLRSDYVTGVGEVRQVRLDDGSQVSLAPQSALAVDYTAGRREVRLIKGRAWFDVRHDPSRPFSVAARDAEARVLGTAFEVDASASGRSSVAVQRGLVGVVPRRGGAMQRVPAGRAVTVDADGGVAGAAVGADAVAAWRDGQLVVENAPVAEVVSALRPWTRQLILVRGRGLAQRRVTGVYDLRDADRAAGALAQAYDLEVTHMTPWITVLSER